MACDKPHNPWAASLKMPTHTHLANRLMKKRVNQNTGSAVMV